MANAPFSIVQVNAAFHRLLSKGGTNAVLLGQPVSALTDALSHALQQAAATRKQVEIEQQIFAMKGEQHRVLITPVGPSAEVITHFTIEASYEEDPDSNCQNSNVAMNVMG
jgi:hypothetical protein